MSLAPQPLLANLLNLLARDHLTPDPATGGWSLHGRPVAVDALPAGTLDQMRRAHDRMVQDVTVALTTPTPATAAALLSWAASYGRMPAIVALHRAGLQHDDVLRLVGEAWTVCDNLAAFRPWLRAVLPPRPARVLMTPDEWHALQVLPERISVYRGADRGVNERGLSWSLDRAVAARFPFLDRYRAAHPVLVTATLRRDRITALKLDREEQEVIALRVRVQSVEPLPCGAG